MLQRFQWYFDIAYLRICISRSGFCRIIRIRFKKWINFRDKFHHNFSIEAQRNSSRPCNKLNELNFFKGQLSVLNLKCIYFRRSFLHLMSGGIIYSLAAKLNFALIFFFYCDFKLGGYFPFLSLLFIMRFLRFPGFLCWCRRAFSCRRCLRIENWFPFLLLLLPGRT